MEKEKKSEIVLNIRPKNLDHPRKKDKKKTRIM
jgi:hypothetical protein